MCKNKKKPLSWVEAHSCIAKWAKNVSKKISQQQSGKSTIIDAKNTRDVIFDDVIEENPIVSVGIVRQNRFIQNLSKKNELYT